MKETFETDYYSDILHYELGDLDSVIDETILHTLANREFFEEMNRLTINNSKKILFTSFIPSPNDNGFNRKKRKREQKGYKCQYEGCLKEYKSKENLNLHIKNKHEGLKPYRCSYCSLLFSHRNGKRYHERSQHTKLLPYPCIRCAQSFASNSSMKAHMKICQKEKSKGEAQHQSQPQTKGSEDCKCEFNAIKEEQYSN